MRSSHLQIRRRYAFHVTARRRLDDSTDLFGDANDTAAVEDFGVIEAVGKSQAIAFAKARNKERVARLGRVHWMVHEAGSGS